MFDLLEQLVWAGAFVAETCRSNDGELAIAFANGMLGSFRYHRAHGHVPRFGRGYALSVLQLERIEAALQRYSTLLATLKQHVQQGEIDALRGELHKQLYAA